MRIVEGYVDTPCGKATQLVIEEELDLRELYDEGEAHRPPRSCRWYLIASCDAIVE